METIYWYDLETFGIDTARDRVAQFAGLRTGTDLEVVGKPCVQYCRPATDYLPDPRACLVTGITPVEALEQGVREADFAATILREFSEPATCVAGYNSIRFDDEFLRYLFYRNFFDPYQREYQAGNSRWDLLDVMRTAHLLRPEGVEWPRREDGSPSFRLEELTAANGIEHTGAHDALADVQATIALARRLRKAQPRLFDYLYRSRRKQDVRGQLDLRTGTPVLHVSGQISPAYACASLFLPLAEHPVNRNAVICFDLRADPAPLLELSPEEIRRRVFSPRDKLGEAERIPLKEVHCNKCAVVMPASWADARALARMQIDPATCEHHAQRLRAAPNLGSRLREVYARQREGGADAEYALYEGFLPDGDRRLATDLRACPPEKLLRRNWQFDDPRMADLLLRYVGRNDPEALTGEHRAQWEALCRQRLLEPGVGARDVQAFFAELAILRKERPDASAGAVLDCLERWAREWLALAWNGPVAGGAGGAASS